MFYCIKKIKGKKTREKQRKIFLFEHVVLNRSTAASSKNISGHVEKRFRSKNIERKIRKGTCVYTYI